MNKYVKAGYALRDTFHIIGPNILVHNVIDLYYYLPMSTKVDPIEKAISQNSIVLKLCVYNNTTNSSQTTMFG